MTKIYFLSHSSQDDIVVKRVAASVGREQCWLYEWDVRPGESIFEFDKAIADSRIFVLFWSNNATTSDMVTDEISQARIRLSRDKGFRLVVVRLDTAPLPPALAYRVYIDGTKGVNSIARSLKRLQDELIPAETFIGSPMLRDSFQNREQEVDLLEHLALSGDSPVIVLGLDGIGKTALVKKAITAVFSHLTPLWVDLEVASTPVRLISSVAKPLSVLLDSHEVANNPEQFWHTVLLPEIRESDRLFIVFDNFQIRTVAGYSRSETAIKLAQAMCRDLVMIRKPNNPGVILISWNEPLLDPDTLGRFKRVEVGPLDRKSIARALRFHLSRVSSLEYDLQKLETLAGQLWGYPAAVGVVARKVAEQGIDAVLTDSKGLRKLRYVIAEELFSRVSLSEDEKNMLILLATSVYPLLERHLRLLPGADMGYFESIRRKELLDPASPGYYLHGVLRDYVLESMARPLAIMECHGRLARLFDHEWKSALERSAERAEYASLCHFHALSSGSRRWARLIQKDYLEEAKAAAVELYRRGQYKTALAYLENARKIDDTSDPIYDFYYGLSLNRLGRSQEALDIMNSLVGRFPRVSRYQHALGTILRRMGKNDDALQHFRKAVSLSTGGGKVTALCSLAELLTDTGRSDEALPLVEEALDLEPGKSFVVGTASMVYEAVGQIDKALEIIRDGLRISPGDTRLHHRAGMILKKMGLFTEAKDHLEQASKDPSLGFSVTALADVYLKLDRVDEAADVVERFPGSKQRNPSYLSTKANILRRQGDYRNAETLLSKAIKLEPYNVVLYGGMAQVKFDQAQQLIKIGDKQTALISLEEARNFLLNGLQVEAQDELLLSLRHIIDKLELEINP